MVNFNFSFPPLHRPIIFNVSEAGMYEANYILATDASDSMSTLGSSTGSEASSSLARGRNTHSATVGQARREVHQTPARTSLNAVPCSSKDTARDSNGKDRENSATLGRSRGEVHEVSARASHTPEVREVSARASPKLVREFAARESSRENSSASSIVTARGTRRVLSSEEDEEPSGAERKRVCTSDVREANNNDGKESSIGRCFDDGNYRNSQDDDCGNYGNQDDDYVGRNEGEFESNTKDRNVSHLPNKESNISSRGQVSQSHVPNGESKSDKNQVNCSKKDSWTEKVDRNGGDNFFDNFIEMESSALGRVMSSERKGGSRNERGEISSNERHRNEGTNLVGDVNNGDVRDRTSKCGSLSRVGIDNDHLQNGVIPSGLERDLENDLNRAKNNSKGRIESYTNQTNNRNNVLNGSLRNYSGQSEVYDVSVREKTSSNRHNRSENRSNVTDSRSKAVNIGNNRPRGLFCDSDSSFETNLRGIESFSPGALKRFETGGDDFQPVEDDEMSQDATLMNVCTPLNPEKMKIVFRHCLEGGREGDGEEEREGGKVLVYESDEDS